MRKEIFIEDLLEDERPRRSRNYHNGHGGGYNRQDKGRGFHIHGGRRDGFGPHLEEGCNTHPEHRIIKKKIYRNEEQMKTKMFTNKKDLVEYVNEVGEKGQRVDIFKIEDDLYKVVVYETKEAKKVKVEVEVED